MRTYSPELIEKSSLTIGMVRMQNRTHFVDYAAFFFCHAGKPASMYGLKYSPYFDPDEKTRAGVSLNKSDTAAIALSADATTLTLQGGFPLRAETEQGAVVVRELDGCTKRYRSFLVNSTVGSEAKWKWVPEWVERGFYDHKVEEVAFSAWMLRDLRPGGEKYELQKSTHGELREGVTYLFDSTEDRFEYDQAQDKLVQTGVPSVPPFCVVQV